MKTIQVKVSEDRKTLQVVEQTARGLAFAPPEPIFATEDGELISETLEWCGNPCFSFPMGPLDCPEDYEYSEADKPVLHVRGDQPELDLEPVQIPSEAWLRGILKTVAAYNAKFGPKDPETA